MDGNLQQPQVDLNQTTGTTCDECHSVFFENVMIIRKVSALLTGTGQPGYVPIPVFRCADCGHVNSEFMPKSMGKSDE